MKIVDGCERCGRCCSHLRDGDDKSGLTLFPEEIHLFPEKLIKPHMARGEKEPLKIFSYQHTENVCVHLENNLCNIYEKRPLMCRSFPVKVGPRGLKFSPGCKAVLHNLKKSSNTDRKPLEIQASLKIAKRLYNFYNSFEDNEVKWNYNLVTDSWEKKQC